MKYIFLTLLLLSFKSNWSQNNDNSFFVGETVIPTNDPEQDSIISLLKRYNAFFINDPYNVINYWDSLSLKQQVLPDYLLKAEFGVYVPKYVIKANLIFLDKLESVWLAKVGYNLYENNIFKGLCCVYNFAVKKQSNDYKFTSIENIFTYSTLEKEGVILKTKSPYISKQSELDTLVKLNKYVSQIFKKDELKFSCYLYQSFYELNHCVGFDVQYNSSYFEENAYTDFINGRIYSSTSAAFTHELVHLYTHKHIPEIHHLLDEGFATMIGGSYNLNVEQHLSKLSIFLKDNKNINLSNFLDYKIYVLDNKTKFRTIMSSMVCILLFKKNGYESVIEFLKTVKTDADFYLAIEKSLHIKRENLNDYLRKEIAKY
jgi:hypothetical protein